MTLGELIAALETLPPDAHIEYDDGSFVGSFDSWRGAYRELTLIPEYNYSWTNYVKNVLREARAAVGHTFQGYKGGDFTMSEETAVWADEYGIYQSRAIIGIEPPSTLSNTYIIRTWVIPYEYR